MSDYKVFNCTVDDAAGLAKCNMTSFYQEPSWNIMWKHTTLDFLIQNTTSRLPKNLLTERGVRRHQKVVHAPSNTIVGYIKWILPESAQNEWLAAQVPDVNDNDHKRFAELHSTTIFDPQQLPEVSDDHYKVWKEKHGPHGPHIVLGYLTCHPEHRRKGIASLLVNSGLKAADDMGLPVSCYAVTTGAAKLYESCGFKALEEKHVDLIAIGHTGTYDTYYMIREPNSAE